MPISTTTKNRTPEGWSNIRIGRLLCERNEKAATAPEDQILTSSRRGLFLQSDYFKRVVSSENIVGYKRMLRGDFTFRSMSDDGVFVFNRLKEFDQGFISPAYFVFYCINADPAFIEYLINSDKLQAQIYKSAQGSTRTSLKFSKLKDFLLLLPESRFEQQKIAEILSTIDDAIDKTDQLIEKHKRIKQELMQDLFRYGIDENGQIRSEETHNFKDSPLGRIPEKWETYELGEYLRRNRGIIQTGPFGSQLHSYEYVSEGIPVVMPQDIARGKILLDKIARITREKARELARHILKVNDVILARRGEFNRAAFIGDTQRGWICGTGCLLLRIQLDKMDGLWFSHLYSSPIIQRQLEAIAVGSTMKNINTNVINSLTIAVPGIEEQRRIAQVILLIDDLIEKEQKDLNKYISLKSGLMKDLLSGAVRVNHLIKN